MSQTLGPMVLLSILHHLMRILGISAYYHDSAVCLVEDGLIVFAAQEERYSRIKHDAAFPQLALADCLYLHPGPVDAVVYYERPLLKFERLLEGIICGAPHTYGQFLRSMPVWAAQKLLLRSQLRKGLRDAGLPGHGSVRILFTDHHLSHAASAYLPSPFTDAAILTIDGVGEHATATIGHGYGTSIEMVCEMRYPHSLGLLYSAFAYFLGFRVNEGEYKLMGLAPYANRDSIGVKRFGDIIARDLATLNDDGSVTLKMTHFTFDRSEQMVDGRKWEALLGISRRQPDSALGQMHCDLALAVQLFTEDAVLRMAAHARRITGCSNLCMAGGVALNCVANARLRNSGLFSSIWVQPAAGDAGGALGAALWADMELRGSSSEKISSDTMQGARLGGNLEIGVGLPADAPYTETVDEETLCRKVAGLLADGLTVGWVQGRMEFGPRALGGRSILADPRKHQMQRDLNLKVKFRESFRPFAPAVTQEAAHEWFELSGKSSYMLFTAQLRPERLQGGLPESGTLTDKLKAIPGPVPAITHVDGSARVQTVSAQTDPLFHGLLTAFGELTHVPMLVNTSLNLRDEPIVRTAADAYRTFMCSGLDVLVIGKRIYGKSDQPAYREPPSATHPPPLRQAWYSLAAVNLALTLMNYRFGSVPLYSVPVLLLVMGIISAPFRLIVHTAWMSLAHLLGRINGIILLTITYMLMVLPIRAFTGKGKIHGGFSPIPKRSPEQQWGAY